MSKRNFILLIIVLILGALFLFGFLYFGLGKNTEGEPVATNFLSRFNPFGTGKATLPKDTEVIDVTPYQPEPITEELNLKLKKVSSMPVAGFTVYQKERFKDIPSETTETPTSTDEATAPKAEPTKTKPITPPTEFFPSLRYVARATGNIYQTFADRIIERKFSVTTIPKIYEAFFGNKGESVVMRYLKEDGRTIQSFVGTMPKEYLAADTTEENEITVSFLPENIKDISLSGDKNSIFYLFNTNTNSEDIMVGTTSVLSTDKKVQIFDSPFTEWLSFWPNSKTITLTTKPSYGVPGYVYSMDATTGKNFTKIFGGVNGLTTLMSPDGKLILYANDALTLSIYHTDTNISDTLGIKTMPEKCVWGKLSDFIYCSVPKSLNAINYPDTWYQGATSFSDQFWKVDVKTGNAETILDPITIEKGEEVDGIKLALDENENYLFFVNKKDSFLWELNLK